MTASPAKTRLGIVGLGMAAAPHARALLELGERVEVAAAFSPTPERRRSFAATYGLPVCNDPAVIFDNPAIHAVLVLTPPNTHLDLVRRAAAAGKHVLLEKPLEISLDRSQALVAAAEEAGVALAIVLQHRFRATSVALGGMLREGRLGVVVGASAALSNWRPQSYYDQPGRGTRARDGGGVLLTQGIHTLDLLISLVGPPVEVSAFAATSQVHRMETEDIAAAAIRFDNGAIGTISATTCAYPGYPDAIEIIGTAGVARLGSGSLEVRFHDGTTSTVEDAAAGGVGADPMAFSHLHHRAVLDDFLNAIAEKREPRVSGREALKVHRVIDAILRSARSKTVQAVGAFPADCKANA